MVSPTRLVATLSAATGIALPTMVDTDRKLVIARLRTKNGRGRNAARVTSLDAARLITAILASPQANQSADAVERYALTQLDRSRSSARLYDGTGLADLAALPDRHCFVDALSAVITSLVNGSLASVRRDNPDSSLPRIEVFAFTRATYGRIRIATRKDAPPVSVEYVLRERCSDGGPANKGPAAAESPTSVGDLEQSRRITERTLISVAVLWSGEEAR